MGGKPAARQGDMTQVGGPIVQGSAGVMIGAPTGVACSVAGEIKADLRTVSHIVTRAIRQLKQLRVDMPGWRKIFEGKRFLYELPWFMVVGSPGDGKTTALLNTGLQFPLAEQMEQTSRILTVPGGGTLHCDWWFTNEAVLIDTAGRYARHDDGGEASAAQRNAGEWLGFLGLLRKHRPGAPLNGVILTLNVADLTAQSPAERLAAWLPYVRGWPICVRRWAFASRCIWWSPKWICCRASVTIFAR